MGKVMFCRASRQVSVLRYRRLRIVLSAPAACTVYLTSGPLQAAESLLFARSAKAPAAAVAGIRKGNATYAQFEAILACEMPAVPLHIDVAKFLQHPRVRCWP